MYTIHAKSINEDMIITRDRDNLYVQEVSSTRDNQIIVRGNFTGFDCYPTATMFFWPDEQVTLVGVRS